MKTFIDYIHEARTFSRKGWINIKNGKMVLWAFRGGTIRPYHDEYVVNNAKKFFRGGEEELIRRFAAMSGFEPEDDETISMWVDIKTGKVDRDPNLDSVMEEDGWRRVVFDEGLSFLETMTRSEGQRAAKIILSKMRWDQIQSISIYDQGHLNDPIEIYNEDDFESYAKTGRVAKRTEIGRTMAMFRGESVEIDRDEFRAHWKKAPILTTGGGNVKHRNAFWDSYFQHFEDKYGEIPKRIKDAMRMSDMKPNPSITYKGKKFSMRTGMDEMDLLYHVLSENTQYSQLDEASYGHTLWIDPRGKVYDMNDRKEITDPKGYPYTHYDWVAANFTKYFGKTAPDDMGKVVYDAPMEQGWVRIRNHRRDMDVEVNLRKLNRTQKKVLRDIYDDGGDTTRGLYIDTWEKNKTNRSKDKYFQDYDSIVDFLSESVINEAKMRGLYFKGWMTPRGRVVLHATTPTGTSKYHIQILTDLFPFEKMRPHMGEWVGAEHLKFLQRMKKDKIADFTDEQLKDLIEKEYRSVYKQWATGKIDQDRGVEEKFMKMGWVKIWIDRNQYGMSMIQGNDKRKVLECAKKLDKKFGGWDGFMTKSMSISIQNDIGARIGSAIRDSAGWDNYLRTGEVRRHQTEIGRKMAMFREWNEEWSQKYKQSIDCNNPKGFSQRAHCQGRKKRSAETG